MHTEGVVAQRRATDPRRKIGHCLSIIMWDAHCKRLDAALMKQGALIYVLNTPKAKTLRRSNRCALGVHREIYYCVERRVESLAVCMPHMVNQCANFYAKDLTLNAERQRLRCAWALGIIANILLYAHRERTALRGAYRDAFGVQRALT